MGRESMVIAKAEVLTAMLELSIAKAKHTAKRKV